MPRTTQNPCSTLVSSTTATAKASPALPRTALRNHTEWKERCEASRRQTATAGGSPVRPNPRLPSAATPAASRVAAATMLVEKPNDRAWKPGSSADAILRDSSAPCPSAAAVCTEPAPSRSMRLDTSKSTSESTNSANRRDDSCNSLMRTGSCTGWAVPSQMRAAQRRSVSATVSIITRMGGISKEAALAPVSAALPATHSTRPTSLARAMAAAAAPVAG